VALKTWFIPALLIVKQRLHGRGVRMKGRTIELYNKNGMCWYRFKNARKCPCHYGYLVDRATCPDYFSQVIVPENRVH